MTKTRSALKLQLDPGEYQCSVNVPDLSGGFVRILGRLHLRSDEPPLVELYGDVPVSTGAEDTGVFIPQRIVHPVLEADLIRGDSVLLLDCVIDTWLMLRSFVHATAAIIRAAKPTTDAYLCVGARVQITGSDAVIAPTPLAQAKMPLKPQPDDDPYVWSVTERLPRSIDAADEHAAISGQRAITFSAPTGWSYNVSLSPVIDIRLEQPIDLRTLIDDWIQPLRRVVSLATGRSERVTHLEVRGADESTASSQTDSYSLPKARQVYGAYIGQDPFVSDDNAVNSLPLAFTTWAEHSTNLLLLVRGWQAAVAAKHPLIETLGTLLFLPDLHPRARLLLYVQALEGLHGFDNQQKSQQRQAKHTAAYDDAVADIANNPAIDPQTLKFVKKHLLRRPPTSLEPALRTVVESLPHDLTAELSNLSLVQSVLTTDGPVVNDWAGAVRVVRNGLSHGDRGWTRDMLEPAAELLELVARAHLMRLIGCHDNDIASWLQRKATN